MTGGTARWARLLCVPLLVAGLAAGPVAEALPAQGFEPFVAADARVAWQAEPEQFRQHHAAGERVVWIGRLESMRYEVSAGKRAKIWLLFRWLPLAQPGPAAIEQQEYAVRPESSQRFGAIMTLEGDEAAMARMKTALEATTHYAVVGGHYAGERVEEDGAVVYIYADAIRLDDKLKVVTAAAP